MHWIKKIEDFCKHYNIPIEYLPETVNEPKVIPMVRGKAFEFSALIKLKSILDPKIWEVRKNIINAQLGMHDEDVTIIHMPSRKKFSIECKLAKKGGFRNHTSTYEIPVKCMRSRTLGARMVDSLAAKFGKTKTQLTTHNDQYLPTDFDIVLTSIGNAFFETDNAGLFYWCPSDDAKEFLKHFHGTTDESNLQKITYDTMYVADSEDLTIKTVNPHVCTRRLCEDKQNCGFIPNYPKIEIDKSSLKPKHTWKRIDDIEQILLRKIST